MSSLKLKKRWFVLTHNSLDYYKSSEKNALKLGTLVLNSLCSVVPPDEKIFKETGNRATCLRRAWLRSAQGHDFAPRSMCSLFPQKKLISC